MEAINLGDWPRELAELVERAEAGEVVQINREGKPVAKLVSIASAEQPIDWDALKAFRESLPYDPVNSVLEMRKQARY